MEERKVTDLSREELIEYVGVLENGIAEVMIEVDELLELNEEIREQLVWYQTNEDERVSAMWGPEEVM